MFRIKVVGKEETRYMFNNCFSENLAVYEINVEKSGAARHELSPLGIVTLITLVRYSSTSFPINRLVIIV